MDKKNTVLTKFLYQIFLNLKNKYFYLLFYF